MTIEVAYHWLRERTGLASEKPFVTVSANICGTLDEPKATYNAAIIGMGIHSSAHMHDTPMDAAKEALRLWLKGEGKAVA